MKTRKNAFTLIELLIVVAIIAILAAIAVPNFLEAQTRAKVSRVHADQRTIATAVESYQVDWGQAPIGYNEARYWFKPVGTILDWWIYPVPGGDQYQYNYPRLWGRMTTPVAYMTSVPLDPFASQGVQTLNKNNVVEWARYYRYESILTHVRGGNRADMINSSKKAFQLGYTWLTESLGPMRSMRWMATEQMLSTMDYLAQVYRPPTSDKIGYPNAIYDPTNGTMSIGRVMRTNKGIAGK